MTKYQNVRGTKDLYNLSASKLAYIQKVGAKTAEKFGFSLAITPIFEFANLFLRNLGESSDIINKEMYLFKDKSGEDLALRPEGTAPLVRMLIANSLYNKLPAKFYYYGPMFRYERPQKGRQREFNQFGIEQFGPKSPLTDALVIKVATSFLNELGVINYTVLVNSLADTITRDKYKEALIFYLNKYKEELSEDSKRRLVTNPLRILDSKDNKDKEILISAPSLHNFYSNKEKDYLYKILEYLDILEIKYTLSNNLVRGLDYYTSTVFEIITNDLGAQGTLIAGGRYDKLVQQMGGINLDAVGWAAGIERLSLLLNETKLKCNKKIGIIITDYQNNNIINKALNIINIINYKNVSVEIVEGDQPIAKKIKKASQNGYDLVIILGNNEISNSFYTVKNLNTHKQYELKNLNQIKDVI